MLCPQKSKYDQVLKICPRVLQLNCRRCTLCVFLLRDPVDKMRNSIENYSKEALLQKISLFSMLSSPHNLLCLHNGFNYKQLLMGWRKEDGACAHPPAKGTCLTPSLRPPCSFLWALGFVASCISSPKALSRGPGMGEKAGIWAIHWLVVGQTWL